MKCREVAQTWVKLVCTELPRRGGGSHRKWFNPITQKLTVIPDWASCDLKLGTLRAAIKQLGIDWADFENA
ncbi:type II toxin-antitoxin system HicA family toxin [Pseudanabaena sp. PCC 6802]|uniref:type II toxin-antitoxin system HicA family toxin n=1 Tax=Pseudanabaena sp. PCC 6802 TaxID=118173 RepID=UPI000382863E